MDHVRHLVCALSIAAASASLAGCRGETPLGPQRTVRPEAPVSGNGPFRDYRGVYSLTVITTDTGDYCPTPTPEEFRRRTYTATIDQNGADLTVALAGAALVIGGTGRGASFRGSVQADDTITFWLRPSSVWDYDEPDVVERLSDGTAICVAGTFYARDTPEGISGTVSHAHGGTIYRCSGNYVVHGGCPIERFELIRR